MRRAPVVIIHGLGQHARDWAEVAARLDRDVVAVDLPALRDPSRTPDPAAGRAVLEQARHLESPHLVGHSYGGHLALELASARWRSLVELLWLDDALALLDRRNAVRGFRSKPRHIVWDRVCEIYDLDEIAAAVRERLKARQARPIARSHA